VMAVMAVMVVMAVMAASSCLERRGTSRVLRVDDKATSKEGVSRCCDG
jgi:hypothetical protein